MILFLCAVVYVVNLVTSGIGHILRKVAEKVIKWGDKMFNGNLKKSFAVVVMVMVQLLVSVSVARTIIFFLLMTSGDVERNPGPECTGMLTAFWLFDILSTFMFNGFGPHA